jgi:hypothetical protein
VRIRTKDSHYHIEDRPSVKFAPVAFGFVSDERAGYANDGDQCCQRRSSGGSGDP